jgi:hypothetical protein
VAEDCNKMSDECPISLLHIMTLKPAENVWSTNCNCANFINLLYEKEKLNKLS